MNTINQEHFRRILQCTDPHLLIEVTALAREAGPMLPIKTLISVLKADTDARQLLLHLCRLHRLTYGKRKNPFDVVKENGESLRMRSAEKATDNAS